jgi:hypothetical protein
LECYENINSYAEDYVVYALAEGVSSFPRMDKTFTQRFKIVNENIAL